MELSKDGTEDVTILMGLLEILIDHGYTGGFEVNPEVTDLLFVMQLKLTFSLSVFDARSISCLFIFTYCTELGVHTSRHAAFFEY